MKIMAYGRLEQDCLAGPEIDGLALGGERDVATCYLNGRRARCRVFTDGVATFDSQQHK